jgi:hypothetical protein
MRKKVKIEFVIKQTVNIKFVHAKKRVKLLHLNFVYEKKKRLNRFGRKDNEHFAVYFKINIQPSSALQ